MRYNVTPLGAFIVSMVLLRLLLEGKITIGTALEKQRSLCIEGVVLA